MDKLAQQVKLAEINGVMGALIEAKVIKVAGEEDYAVLLEAITERLPEDYNLDTVLGIIDEVMTKYDEFSAPDEVVEEEVAAEAEEEAAAEEVMAEAIAEEEAAKEASVEIPTEEELMALYGHISMSKTAGEISDADFEKESAGIMDMLKALKGQAGRAADGAKAYGGAAVDAVKARPAQLKSMLSDHSGAQKGLNKEIGGLKTQRKAEIFDKDKQLLSGGINDRRKQLWSNRAAIMKALAPEAAVATGVGAGAVAGGMSLRDMLRQEG